MEWDGRMDDPMAYWKRAYVPCRCWSADHLLCVDVDPDLPDELNIAIVSSRNCSIWRRLRWAMKHVFGRDDLVFADIIVNRDQLHSTLFPTPVKEHGDE